jgi:hypothetical protein
MLGKPLFVLVAAAGALGTSFSAPSAAGCWSLFDDNLGGTEVYLDYSTIEQVNRYARIWARYNYAHPTSAGSRSVRVLQEFDCREERHRVLTITAFAGENLTGREIGTAQRQTEWNPTVPGTIGASLRSAVCSYQPSPADAALAAVVIGSPSAPADQP